VVEPRTEPDLHDEPARQACATRLSHAVKAYVGVSVRVRIAPVGEIERSAGKARRIIDRRPKD